MSTINFSEINWIAVIVAAIASFMLGGLWYGALFGKPWSKAQGWTDEQIATIKAAMSPPKFFTGMILSYLVLAFVIAVLASAAGVQTWTSGACLGGVVWLATACVTMTHHLASGKVIAAYLYDVSFEFIYLLLMGAIIGAWH